MPLLGLKLELLDNSLDSKLRDTYQRFCLIFTHNKSFSILYPECFSDSEKWFQHLKKSCVLSYFSKHFTNISLIGFGSFAKVALSKRSSDGMKFAVKTFDKKKVLDAKGKANKYCFYFIKND